MKLQSQDILNDLCGDAAELDLLVSQMKDLMVGCKLFYFLFIKSSVHSMPIIIIINS
jgi:hypothetical protein